MNARTAFYAATLRSSLFALGCSVVFGLSAIWTPTAIAPAVACLVAALGWIAYSATRAPAYRIGHGIAFVWSKPRRIALEGAQETYRRGIDFYESPESMGELIDAIAEGCERAGIPRRSVRRSLCYLHITVTHGPVDGTGATGITNGKAMIVDGRRLDRIVRTEIILRRILPDWGALALPTYHRSGPYAPQGVEPRSLEQWMHRHITHESERVER